MEQTTGACAEDVRPSGGTGCTDRIDPTLRAYAARVARGGTHVGASDSDLQRLLDGAARTTGVVGAALAIFDGERTRVFTTGVANEAAGRPVTSSTMFQIGSATKIYNAALVMQLVDDGLVDLDEPVVSYLPDLRVPDADANEAITLRQLLSMSSGLDNGPYTDHGPGDDAVSRYVAELSDVPVICPPGKMFGYSNAGTVVAGAVVERLTGVPWRQALTERLLAPSRLADTLTAFEDLVYRDVAVGYAPGPDGRTIVRPWRLPVSMEPAGSTLCTTAGDAAAFCRMLLDGGRSGAGDQVLSEVAVEAMCTPNVELPPDLRAHSDAWCVGPTQKRWDGATLYGHAGVNRSGSSNLLWCPERNFAVVTLVNVPAVAHHFNRTVIGTVLADLFGITAPALPVADDGLSPDLDRLVGAYERYGARQEVTVQDGRLCLTFTDDPDQRRTALAPVTATSFVPADPTEHTVLGWPLAFIGSDREPATHVLNGIFAARRVGG